MRIPALIATAVLGAGLALVGTVRDMQRALSQIGG